MIDLVAFGVILDDIVFPDGQTQMAVLGGGGAQTAWGMAAALGGGQRVGLSAGVGDDLPPTALAPLYAAGVNLDGLRQTPYPTPRAWQILEHDGTRRQLWRVPMASLGPQLARNWDLLPAHYQAAEWFHWGIHLEDGVPPLARQLGDLGKCISLEPFRDSTRPLTADEQSALYSVCMVFSPNESEFAALIGESLHEKAAHSFQQSGGKILALRQGAAGATVFDGRQMISAPAYQTTVEDVTGAGNAFCGAFLARLSEGTETALIHALVVASYMVEQVGVPAGLPTREDYQKRWDALYQERHISRAGI